MARWKLLRQGGEQRRLPALPIIPDAPDRSFPEWKNVLVSVSSFHSRKPLRAGEGPDSFLSSPPHLYLVVPPELLAPDTYQGTFPDHAHPDWHDFPSTAMPLIEHTCVFGQGVESQCIPPSSDPRTTPSHRQLRLREVGSSVRGDKLVRISPFPTTNK